MSQITNSVMMQSIKYNGKNLKLLKLLNEMYICTVEKTIIWSPADFVHQKNYQFIILMVGLFEQWETE